MSHALRFSFSCGVLALMILGSACGRGSPDAASEAYQPGLGELMTLQQMRHIKLWLAGHAGQWAPAAYARDELSEGFDDVFRSHPTHKDAPVAPKDASPKMITQPLADLREAVTRKDSASFAQAYGAFTTACNNCHQATNFGFNRVQRPESNPYPNQVFARPAQP